MNFKQRELSFRVWDKCFEEFVEIFSMDGKGYISVPYLKERDILFYNENGNFITTQFIGILDKNGNKIYEGDILALPLQPHHKNKRRLVTVMEFQDFLNWECDEESPKVFYSEMEILGNIFENPELVSKNLTD